METQAQGADLGSSDDTGTETGRFVPTVNRRPGPETDKSPWNASLRLAAWKVDEKSSLSPPSSEEKPKEENKDEEDKDSQRTTIESPKDSPEEAERGSGSKISGEEDASMGKKKRHPFAGTNRDESPDAKKSKSEHVQIGGATVIDAPPGFHLILEVMRTDAEVAVPAWMTKFFDPNFIVSKIQEEPPRIPKAPRKELFAFMQEAVSAFFRDTVKMLVDHGEFESATDADFVRDFPDLMAFMEAFQKQGGGILSEILSEKECKWNDSDQSVEEISAMIVRLRSLCTHNTAFTDKQRAEILSAVNVPLVAVEGATRASCEFSWDGSKGIDFQTECVKHLSSSNQGAKNMLEALAKSTRTPAFMKAELCSPNDMHAWLREQMTQLGDLRSNLTKWAEESRREAIEQLSGDFVLQKAKSKPDEEKQHLDAIIAKLTNFAERHAAIVRTAIQKALGLLPQERNDAFFKAVMDPIAKLFNNKLQFTLLVHIVWTEFAIISPYVGRFAQFAVACSKMLEKIRDSTNGSEPERAPEFDSYEGGGSGDDCSEEYNFFGDYATQAPCDD